MNVNLPLAFVMGQSPMELFVHGGWIMWPILIVSFVAVTTVVERILFLMRENNRRQPERVEQMLDKVEKGDYDGARGIGESSTDYVAQILVSALTHHVRQTQSALPGH